MRFIAFLSIRSKKEWKIDTIYLTEDPLFYCTLDAFLWNWEGYTISFIFQLAQVL